MTNERKAQYQKLLDLHIELATAVKHKEHDKLVEIVDRINEASKVLES